MVALMTTTTTAEFVIGREADDALERKRELRKIGWALLAALFIHLVIGYVIAASHGLFSSITPMEEDKPVELTFVDMPPPAPAVPKNPMFMETDPMKASVEPPKDKTFESNANSIAAAELPATGNIPLPSQEGKDRPNLDLETHASSLAAAGAQPQPSAAPQESASPSVAPSVQPTATPLPDQLAMLKSTPTPRPSVAPTPQQPGSAYRAQKQQTRLSGSISNRGASSLNALGTPLGRYQKQLYDAIGSRWYSYVGQRGENSIGTVRLAFSVDRSGRVRNLKVIQSSSNETFANICIQSVQEVQMPPIPEDVASTLPSEGLETELSFTVYQN
jgi:TonB family protein